MSSAGLRYIPRYARLTCSLPSSSRAAAHEHHPAILEHVAPRGQRQRLARVLLHQHHGGARAIDRRHGPEDLLHHHGRQPQGRLVEHQEAWAGHQGSADGEHLLLAARHGAGRLAPALGENGEEREDARQALRHGRARVGAQLEILPPVRLGKIFRPSGTCTTPPSTRVTGQPDSIRQGRRKISRPARAEEARDGAQHGGLAGAVGAHHGEDLAFRHRQGAQRSRGDGPQHGRSCSAPLAPTTVRGPRPPR